jgi:hypothetical protein
MGEIWDREDHHEVFFTDTPIQGYRRAHKDAYTSKLAYSSTSRQAKHITNTCRTQPLTHPSSPPLTPSDDEIVRAVVQRIAVTYLVTLSTIGDFKARGPEFLRQVGEGGGGGTHALTLWGRRRLFVRSIVHTEHVHTECAIL